MPIDILEDLVPDDNKLKLISSLASSMIAKANEILAAQEVLKALQSEFTQLETVDLPNAMLSAGLESFSLAQTGISIELNKGMSISVPKKNKPLVCQWLRDNGHEDIISNEFVVPLPKGEDKKVERLVAGLERLQLTYTHEENVNSGTLKALLKEQRGKGVELDLKMFGAWEYFKAEIVLPK